MPDHTVLLVDDEPALLEELQEGMVYAGLSVMTATSVAVALDILDLEHVDLIVTDLKMPGRGGLDLLRTLSARPGQRPAVIVLSGHGADRNRAEATRLGASACFAKPVDPDDLVDAINGVLA